MCLQFTDFKTDSEMRSFHDFIQELELRQMKYLGLNEETCNLYNSQIRQDKDGKYDPYLLVKVPFKNNRYEVDICNKDSSITGLEMINARNKLKVYKGPVVLCPYENTKKNRYKINKYLAIKYCEAMIVEEDDKFKDLYNKSKKKDDLSDSYLQGIYYLNK